MFNFGPPTQLRPSSYVCGLYYTLSDATNSQLEKYYLPQIELQAHSTILSTTSRTTLRQIFSNPSDTKGIKKVRYTFPLYDSVSVVGFTCQVGDRTILGEVKEKEKAKQVFQEAVSRGETASLFEQLPEAADAFTTTIGNIPPGANVIIKITYLGELKHDAEVDGIRFTIPMIICPRYGKQPPHLSPFSRKAHGNGISIIVDTEMGEGSFVQQIRSPSHPIAVSMGTTSFAPSAKPKMTKASATLSLSSAQLDSDFVLQIIAKDTGVPKAILESHPTIPNQRALMATLVPKFSLPPEKPEVVFVCDRSGSMSGSRITLVRQALQVFLKSLPVGVKFNICSFGSNYSFLWPKSKTYSQHTLDEAVRHVETFDANFGGTEIFQPLKGTIDQRYKDIPLEVMLLTDGEIWNQIALFSYLNKEVTATKAPIRVFTLGVGNGVSHSLIEGVARAGNGFSQTVGEGEKMDSKVVRMLKGALSPHVDDYTLEVKYSDDGNMAVANEDDFEFVENVADNLKVKFDLTEKQEMTGSKKPISLFDPSVDPDKDEPQAKDESGESPYAHLPRIIIPRIIQAPQRIPSLFAFNRTTVYLLMGPESLRKTPKSVVLRATSAHGPLVLEIPVQVLETTGETIHQLAAKKAIAELEQGRGWLSEAKDDSEYPLKEKFESRFDDMVEREAVRLGMQFQVGGKWCSFVAVERNQANKSTDQKEKDEYEWLDVPSKDIGNRVLSPPPATEDHPVRSQSTLWNLDAGLDHMEGIFNTTSSLGNPFGQQSLQQTKQSNRSYFRSLFGSPAPAPAPLQAIQAGSAFPSGALFSNLAAPRNIPSSPPGGAFDSTTKSSQPAGNHALRDYRMDLNLLAQQDRKRMLMSQRGEKIDTLSDKTESLSSQSKQFDVTVKKQSPTFDGLSEAWDAPESSAVKGAGSPSASGGLFDFGSVTKDIDDVPNSSEGPSVDALALDTSEIRKMTTTPDESSTNTDVPIAKPSLFGGSFNPAPAPKPAPPSGGLSGPPAPPYLATQNPRQQVLGISNLPPSSGGLSDPQSTSTSISLFGSTSMVSPPLPTDPSSLDLFGSTSTTASVHPPASAPSSTTLFGSSTGFGSALATQPSSSPFSTYTTTPAFGSQSTATPASSTPFQGFGSGSSGSLFGSFSSNRHHAPGATFTSAVGSANMFGIAVPNPLPQSDDEIINTLISLQTFEGFWEFTPNLCWAIGVDITKARDKMIEYDFSNNMFATALVVSYFERKLAVMKGSWELVVEKAKGWLEGQAWKGSGDPVEVAGGLLN